MGLFKKKSHNREPEELPPEKVSESIIPRAFLHSHTSRVGVATSADGSAVTAETSGTLETRQQWAPALRNISELIRDWDRELSALDPNADTSPDERILDSFRVIQDRLPQCKMKSPDQYPAWQPDEETKRLVFLSAYASKAAYGTIPVDESPYLEKNSLQIMTEQTFKPTFDGSIKQLALRIVATSDSSHDRTIFVAVRGSAPMVDWLINFNGDEVDTPFLSNDPSASSELRQAHTGFLRVAERMERTLTENVVKCLCETKENVHIVFTGHSAGGAVAAVLFLHYLNRKTFGDARISCITFAAPPTVSNSSHTTTPLPPNSIFLSIVNENDPVPRADKAYIYSFAQLYSSYKNNATETLHAWAPPVPKLHVPAESAIVMLRPQPGGDEEELVVAMHKMRVEEFERTLAIDAEAHKMDWYLEELKAWNGGR